MIVRISFLLLFLLSGILAFSQKIDSLKTDAEVLAFVRSIDKSYKDLFIVPPDLVHDLYGFQEPLKKFGPVSWEKADFDDNGRTDLLLNGYFDLPYNHWCKRLSLVVLSYGNDSFAIQVLNKGPFMYSFAARSIVIDGKNYIKIINYNDDGERKNSGKYFAKTDTLMYALGRFIEKSTPGHFNVKKIEFGLSGGGLWDPDLNYLEIVRDSAIMVLKKFQKDSDSDRVEEYACKIDSLTTYSIYGLLNHINFPNLKEEYHVTWSDALWNNFEINYDKGKIKRIADAGFSTYGLMALEEILIDMEKTQHWKKISTSQVARF